MSIGAGNMGALTYFILRHFSRGGKQEEGDEEEEAGGDSNRLAINKIMQRRWRRAHWVRVRDCLFWLRFVGGKSKPNARCVNLCQLGSTQIGPLAVVGPFLILALQPLRSIYLFVRSLSPLPPLLLCSPYSSSDIHHAAFIYIMSSSSSSSISISFFLKKKNINIRWPVADLKVKVVTLELY